MLNGSRCRLLTLVATLVQYVWSLSNLVGLCLVVCCFLRLLSPLYSGLCLVCWGFVFYPSLFSSQFISPLNSLPPSTSPPQSAWATRGECGESRKDCECGEVGKGSKSGECGENWNGREGGRTGRTEQYRTA